MAADELPSILPSILSRAVETKSDYDIRLLAQQLGTNYRSLMYWLRGERNMPAYLLPRICTILGNYEARDYLEVPICVENVSSYAEFHVSEMTEWEFLSEVVELADCGILLDVNNIYVSSQNHNFDPLDYVNGVPHHRVGQIHIAGHSKFERYILDTHDHPVLDPVWKLYDRAIRLTGHTATLLEWDDRIPSFDDVHHEALKASRYLDSKKTAA